MTLLNLIYILKQLNKVNQNKGMRRNDKIINGRKCIHTYIQINWMA